MLDERDFDELVGLVYEAVTEPTGFQPFVERLKVAMGLRAAMMLTANAETMESKGLWVAGMEMAWIERYALEFAGEDMLAQHMHTEPLASFYASNLDLDAGAYTGSRFYREWVLPQEIACASGAVVLREGPWCSQIVLQRRPDQAPFSRAELALCDRLIPHVRRAVQMRQRFAEASLGNGGLHAGLDLLSLPSVLIDEFGRVVHANHSARELLASESSLAVHEGHLQIQRPELTRRLNLALMAAVRASRGDIAQAPGLVVVPRASLRHLILMISPLRLGEDQGIRGSAILFIYDTQSTPSMTAAMIERLFALSTAEAELAVALCAGRTLEEAAAERGTSLHTVRSQLKSLFSKTGTKRQADLIVLLLSSPAYFLSSTVVEQG